MQDVWEAEALVVGAVGSKPEGIPIDDPLGAFEDLWVFLSKKPQL